MRILITGANRGLGLALSQAGAERGHQILAGVRDLQTSTERLMQSEVYKSISLLPLDVTDEESVSSAANAVKENFGTIDVIINNAGVLLERDKQIEDLDLDQVKVTFDVNFFGPIKVVKHFLPLLMMGDRSSIINISSESGSMSNAFGGDYAYASSKTALNMFTLQLNQYVKNKNINVYSVHPGWIKTDMGGDRAPGNPIDTAKGIFDIIEGKREIGSSNVFITYEGQPMPL
ncbi:NAD(P)-dependent dehydrogenase (short-subunit alcohol dehydrogenase family) [Neobacillus niacini]|uniref:SDR family NAD(P)-dependent oxidoreductase n=1 Tax=Neobacillus niacini TaxID=86668 RepID=UPI002789E594|nr:SDR family NAD(P)-dependent oxidoreductase [Neobacillus niacini]MDQ1003286.1 NAD(P)-dependent dehydrogenase (short-subunit alcohol dehydrogenase family) [Neobacillus niacini]